jgi:dTDP-4-dehydrorhamnose 3,5-epimerase
MEFRKTGIEGLVEVYPKIFKDERGFFLETYNKEAFHKNGVTSDFVQDNQSYSVKGVLRGLHLQKDPSAQAKLVRVIKGSVLDVAVDLRKGSPTYGHHYKVILEAELQNMLYIPEGFAHGFLALEECVFTYKCSNLYNKAAESGVLWNDKDLNIDWGISSPSVSEKDLLLPSFKEFSKNL